jgi:hypothetical protein
MSVVIDGSTGVYGTPALRGDDPDTGVFFNDNAVTVSTNGEELASFTPSGISLKAPLFLDVAGTGALKTPVGTTAQRPTPSTGQVRFNSTLGVFEGYDGSAWVTFSGGGGGFEQTFMLMGG